MTELAYIYLLQDGKDKDTNVYKIGRTVQKGGDGRKLQRLQGYTKGTIPYNIWKVNTMLVKQIEKEIKDQFKECYHLVRGSEWFQGDVKQMKNDIDKIIENMNNDDIAKGGSDCENDDVCIACNGSGISYWNDDIHGECLGCGANVIEKVADGTPHFTSVEDVIRCNLVSKEDKNALLYTLKHLVERSDIHSCMWNSKIGDEFYQYKVHRNQTLMLSPHRRIVIPHVRSNIVVDTKENGGHVSFEKYMRFKYSCSGNCQYCMNTRIQYKYMDEDYEYAHCSCDECYHGGDWGNDMFCFFTT